MCERVLDRRILNTVILSYAIIQVVNQSKVQLTICSVIALCANSNPTKVFYELVSKPSTAMLTCHNEQHSPTVCSCSQWENFEDLFAF
uniref:Uncharacterized protein n=1 Tax=Ipomoea batatas TaxID=4120 RepID=Q5MG96_IPOBA|nr:hypothetical protein 8 [Ipomoea batatas]